MSIGPKSNSQNIDIAPASDNEVTLGFLSFCFSYILWVDDSAAIPPLPPVIPLSLSLLILVLPDLPSNSNTNKDDENISSDSKDELSLPFLSSRQSLVPQIQQQSTCLEIKSMPDYYNRGKTSIAKTNSFVLLGSPHFKSSPALFQYALTYIPAQASQGSVQIVRKGKYSISDMPSLKEVMRSPGISGWK